MLQWICKNGDTTLEMYKDNSTASEDIKYQVYSKFVER